MNRRGFLQSLLAIAAAPALARAEPLLGRRVYEGWPPPYSPPVRPVTVAGVTLESNTVFAPGEYTFSAFIRRPGEAKWSRICATILHDGDTFPRVMVRSDGSIDTLDGRITSDFGTPSVIDLEPDVTIGPPGRADGIVGFCDNGIYCGTDGYFGKERGISRADIPPILGGGTGPFANLNDPHPVGVVVAGSVT